MQTWYLAEHIARRVWGGWSLKPGKKWAKMRSKLPHELVCGLDPLRDQRDVIHRGVRDRRVQPQEAVTQHALHRHLVHIVVDASGERRETGTVPGNPNQKN